MKKEIKEAIKTSKELVENYRLEEAIECLMNCDDDVFEFLTEYGIEHIDTIEEIAKNEIEQGGLSRISYFIGDTNFSTDEYYLINGYGNVENIDKDFLEGLIYDLENNFKD